MSPTSDLYIVIPVHNRKDFTRGCLEALQRQSASGFHIVVIDDGSTDGTGRMIRERFESVTLLEGDGDLWWSGATNMGVQYALERSARWILSLNDDTLPRQDFVEQMMLAALDNPRAVIGAVGADSQGQLVFGGEVVNWLTARFVPLLSLLPAQSRVGLHEVTHCPGRGLLIPADAFRELGLFDVEHFPQAVADYDFTHRARRAGYTVLCNYDAKLLVFPEESGSARLRSEKSWRNYYEHLFGRKGGGNLKLFAVYAFRNCPKRYLPFFLVSGIARRIGGYLRDWVLERERTPTGSAG